MKLNDVKPVIESSGDMEEQSFSVHDMGMIFDILRNKIYSNPIQAICREISCNARDAHREVGKDDVPCKITLPNALEPYFKVKDYGPGISPERMSNVFLKYTASTKRDDNTQTGGFGLGAKTPFSYSDSFSIETVVNGTKYCYSCFIDPSKVGKLNLMSQELTEEANGTEIIIAIKPQDFKFFSEYTEYVTRHWTTRPVVVGSTYFKWNDVTPSLKGKNWFISKTDGNVRRDVKLIVDGIEYPVDIYALKGYANTSILDAIYGVIYLNFGVGELSLQASREAVHLDKPTQDAIMVRLKEIAADLTANVQMTVDALPNLWSANCYYNNELLKTFANINFLGNLEYKGTKLTKGQINFTNANVYTFTKGGYQRRGTNDTNKVSRTIKHSVYFTEHTELYENDLGIKDPTVKNVLKAFEFDTTLQNVLVVQPSESTTDTLADIVKKHDLDKYELKKLSTITKQGKSYTISGVRLLVFKFEPINGVFKQVKYADMEADTNKRVICSLERDAYNSTRRTTLKNNKHIGNDILKSLLQTIPDVSIYGVDDSIPEDKVKEHFDDFEPIDDFINTAVSKTNPTVDYKHIKYAMRQTYAIVHRNIKSYPAFKASIKDSDSLYLKNLELQMLTKDLQEKQSDHLRIYESIHGTISDSEVTQYIETRPELSVDLMTEQVKLRYPLLHHLDYYIQDKVMEPIIHYINLVDKELKQTNTI